MKAERIIADHVRTAVFMLADGVLPSNTDRGYILRRLLRRAVRHADFSLAPIADVVIKKYALSYPDIQKQKTFILSEIKKEEEKFRETLNRGLKEFEKLSKSNISGENAFILFSSYGFPLEVTLELAKEKGIIVDVKGFETEMQKHQTLSRSGSEKKFKGGLGDTSEMSVKYHTATHLLNSALRKVLGSHVMQKGSNITPERLRFDFVHTEKMTDEQKKRVEDLVNGWISEKLPVGFKEIPKTEAEKVAIHAFGDKYGDVVRVYSVGTEDNYISREFCGGPHVENTSVLGKFKIQKEEAVSAGVRRIKAVLE